MKRENKEQGFVKACWGVALIVSVVVGSIFFTQFITRYGENLGKVQLQALADTAAASFDTDTILKLQGKHEDIGTVSSDCIRDQSYTSGKAGGI